MWDDLLVERDVDLDRLGDEILNILELVKLVLAHNILSIGNNHACHETSKWGDTISLTDTQDRGVDVGGTSLQSAVRVGNGATGIIVEMSFNITADNTAKSSDQIINLSW